MSQKSAFKKTKSTMRLEVEDCTKVRIQDVIFEALELANSMNINIDFVWHNFVIKVLPGLDDVHSVFERYDNELREKLKKLESENSLLKNSNLFNRPNNVRTPNIPIGGPTVPWVTPQPYTLLKDGAPTDFTTWCNNNINIKE